MYILEISLNFLKYYLLKENVGVWPKEEKVPKDAGLFWVELFAPNVEKLVPEPKLEVVLPNDEPNVVLF